MKKAFAANAGTESSFRPGRAKSFSSASDSDWEATGTRSLQAEVRNGAVQVTIRGVSVGFPFQPYGSQLAVMSQVLKAVCLQQHALIESPTGIYSLIYFFLYFFLAVFEGFSITSYTYTSLSVCVCVCC